MHFDNLLLLSSSWEGMRRINLYTDGGRNSLLKAQEGLGTKTWLWKEDRSSVCSKLLSRKSKNCEDCQNEAGGWRRRPVRKYYFSFSLEQEGKGKGKCFCVA